MNSHSVWLGWASGFLVPWLILYAINPRFRPVMWRGSLLPAVFGLVLDCTDGPGPNQQYWRTTGR
jgi:hypothetical protein